MRVRRRLVSERQEFTVRLKARGYGVQVEFASVHLAVSDVRVRACMLLSTKLIGQNSGRILCIGMDSARKFSKNRLGLDARRTPTPGIIHHEPAHREGGCERGSGAMVVVMVMVVMVVVVMVMVVTVVSG